MLGLLLLAQFHDLAAVAVCMVRGEREVDKELQREEGERRKERERRERGREIRERGKEREERGEEREGEREIQREKTS